MIWDWSKATERRSGSAMCPRFQSLPRLEWRETKTATPPPPCFWLRLASLSSTSDGAENS
eukprot:1451757-Pleurochrysis_carterae.AAC.2